MLLTERAGSVLNVKLDRPEVRNAFNDELIAALTNTFTNIEDDVRVIVLSGEGQSFCAGGDLQWMKKAASYSEEQNYEDALKLAELFRAIATCHPVVIARVHGAAFGGGTGLVAAADIAVAAEGTRFAFSEVKLGLVPATISMHVIPKIGEGNARAYFVSGEPFDSDTALRIGLVHGVVPVEGLDHLVNSKVKQVLSAGPKAAHASKMLAQSREMSIEETARLLASMRAGEEGKEGVAAFLEKRKASFVNA